MLVWFLVIERIWVGDSVRLSALRATVLTAPWILIAQSKAHHRFRAHRLASVESFVVPSVFGLCANDRRI